MAAFYMANLRQMIVRNRDFGNHGFGSRSISDLVKNNAKRLFPFDTLALVRRLEAEGLPTKQAEAISAAMTEILNDSLETISYSFVSKSELFKNEMSQESNLSKFKTEVKSSQEHHLSLLQHEVRSFQERHTSEVKNSQEHHFSLLNHETEKLKSDIDKMRGDLKSELEKMRSELKYELDKVTAGQRLDLNLEKGKMRDELKLQNQETCNLANKLDNEMHGLRAQLEAAKYDVIKYCIGTVASVAAVGLAILRLLM